MIRSCDVDGCDSEIAISGAIPVKDSVDGEWSLQYSVSSDEIRVTSARCPDHTSDAFIDELMDIVNDIHEVSEENYMIAEDLAEPDE